MSHRRVPAIVATIALLVALPGAVTAGQPARGSAETPNGDSAREHARIVAHWTPARLATAVPRDFVADSNGGFHPAGRGETGKPDKPPGKPKPTPSPTPTPPGGGTVTGASWTGGGPIKAISGKVYFEMGGGGYVCSGAVADDTRPGDSLVLTAGHCAYDETAGAFARNWLFIPDFDGAPTFTCSQTVHGCWTATALVVHSGYATAGGFNTQATVHDFAFAVVGPGGKSSTQLDATVGSFDLAFNSFASGTSMSAFGYPAAGKYMGRDLVYCQGPVSYDPLNSNLTYRMGCNMTGGSSGGPWLSSFSGGTGTLSSLNSYGYSGITAMHGPKFGSMTQAVWNAANGATSNTIATGG
jgi:V8-like Glu-specific endopeptidase